MHPEPKSPEPICYSLSVKKELATADGHSSTPASQGQSCLPAGGRPAPRNSADNQSWYTGGNKEVNIETLLSDAAIQRRRVHSAPPAWRAASERKHASWRRVVSPRLRRPQACPKKDLHAKMLDESPICLLLFFNQSYLFLSSFQKQTSLTSDNAKRTELDAHRGPETQCVGAQRQANRVATLLAQLGQSAAPTAPTMGQPCQYHTQQGGNKELNNDRYKGNISNSLSLTLP